MCIGVACYVHARYLPEDENSRNTERQLMLIKVIVVPTEKSVTFICL